MGSCLTAGERENSNRRETWRITQILQEQEIAEARFSQHEGSHPREIEWRMCPWETTEKEKKVVLACSPFAEEREVNSSRLWSQGGWRKEINRWRMSTQGLEVENCERRDHSLAHPQKGKKLTWSLSVVPDWFRLNLTYPLQPKVSTGVSWLARKLHPVNVWWAENTTSCKHTGCPLGQRRAKQQHHGVPLAPACQLLLRLSRSLEDYPTTGPSPGDTHNS